MYSQQTPKVSIGLPVYNGENYVELMLDSILGQTFEDFELIISNNASTDRTAEICARYMGSDPRIRYFLQEKNTGVADNLNFVYEQARAEYFCWTAHDDILMPDFLKKCVDVLDQEHDVVLAFPRIRQIDEHGAVTGEWKWSPEEIRVDSGDARIRFRDLISVRHGCGPLFGLMRSSALGQTRLIGKFSSSDRNLLAELGLIGKWHFIQEVLIDRRRHPKDSLRLYPNERDRMVFYDPAWTGRITFPAWRTLGEFTRSVLIGRVPLGVKLGCLMDCVRWAVLYWRPLGYEIWSAPRLFREAGTRS